MKGAIVFLVVFAIVVIVTIANPAIPPGAQIYAAVLPGTEAAATYLIGGVSAITVIISVFNGVIFAFIAWLIFTILNALVGKKDKQKQNIQQVVNVNVSDKKDVTSSPPPPPPQ